MNEQGIKKLKELGAEVSNWQVTDRMVGIHEGYIDYSFEGENYSITWDDAIYWASCSDIDMSDIIHDSTINQEAV